MRRVVHSIFVALLFIAPGAEAWQEVAPGVHYRRFLSATADIHVARVDLRAVDVVATPETDRGLAVSDFARRRAAIVAVNADFFSPERQPVGLSVGACGHWKTTADNAREAVVAFGGKRVEVYRESDLTSAEPWMRAALGGFPVLVRGCRALRSEELPGRDAFTRSPHPRTAVGFSRTKRTMYLVVADGRRPGVPGLTLPELAAWMRKTLRVCSALNFDGGGSSAMWVGNRVVNRPSDGRERPVANHLAVVRRGAAVQCE